jgi:hypothetical protein
MDVRVAPVPRLLLNAKLLRAKPAYQNPMPTIGETVPGASAPLSWESVRGKTDSIDNRTMERDWRELVPILLVLIALIVGGSILLALVLRYL